MGVGCRKRQNHMAEQWVHTELYCNNLVETRTETFGAVCMVSVSVWVCACVCVCMWMHMCTRTRFEGGLRS